MRNRHIAVICNPGSGKGKPLRLLPEVQAYLLNQHIPFRLFIRELPASLDGFTDLLILGGDGTVNYTLNHFKQISIPVGIIPCGTGNDFGFCLLGKQKFAAYLQRAIHGEPQTVDAGRCNGRYFVVGVGIGFDGWVVRKLLAKKLFTGKAAYYSTVVTLLMFYRESIVRITRGGETQQANLFMFSAANVQTYGGGFRLAPQAHTGDGKLDLLTVSRIGLFTRARYLPVIEKGNHLKKKHPFIAYTHGHEVLLESDRVLQAHLDGEWFEAQRFEISSLPGYLKVRC